MQNAIPDRQPKIWRPLCRHGHRKPRRNPLCTCPDPALCYARLPVRACIMSDHSCAFVVAGLPAHGWLCVSKHDQQQGCREKYAQLDCACYHLSAPALHCADPIAKGLILSLFRCLQRWQDHVRNQPGDTSHVPSPQMTARGLNGGIAAPTRRVQNAQLFGRCKQHDAGFTFSVTGALK